MEILIVIGSLITSILGIFFYGKGKGKKRQQEKQFEKGLEEINDVRARKKERRNDDISVVDKRVRRRARNKKKPS